jgi:hypothetical protein
MNRSSPRTRWLMPCLALAALGLTFAMIVRFPTRPTESIASRPAGATAPTAGPRLSRAASTPGPEDRKALCRACADQNRGGLCVKEMGCEGLTGPDKGLCESLLRCLDEHPECSAKNPALCYCGTAQGMACLRAPNGPCAKQALAAAKTDDPMESAQRFFVPTFPSGRASQVAACHLRACRSECLGVPL